MRLTHLAFEFVSRRQRRNRIDNDNKKTVGVLGAYNLPTIFVSRELVTDSSHAGELLMPPTGAGGEDKRQLADDKTVRADSIMEWDPGQSAGVSTDQTAADDIRILLFQEKKSPKH